MTGPIVHRKPRLAALVGATGFLIPAVGLAQDIPSAPIPAGPVPAAPAPAAPVHVPVPASAPAAPQLQTFQKVEVEDPIDKGHWDPCTILEVFQGAYAVSCNYERSIRRDIHVRPIGGQPPAQSAARPATGEPWPRGAIVLGSPMGQPDDWRLCVIRRNDVAASNSYVVTCGASDYRLLPRWIRADPESPPSS